MVANPDISIQSQPLPVRGPSMERDCPAKLPCGRQYGSYRRAHQCVVEFVASRAFDLLFAQQDQRINRERALRRNPCGHQTQHGHRQNHPGQDKWIAR